MLKTSEINEHSESPACRRAVLTRSPIGSVERCECGALHLSIGALSLRLEPIALRVLGAMIHEALARLDREHHSRVRGRA